MSSRWKRWLQLFLAIVISLFIVLGIYLAYAWNTATRYTIAGVPVLNYHAVNDEKCSPLVVTVPHFAEQMKYLHTHGYHTITMDELYAYLVDGKPLPDKPIVLTFDDGYTDNYTHAFPILQQYGFKATLFMVADSIGQPRFLTAQQLLDMDAHGFAVESHTYTHRNMTTLQGPALREDLIKGRIVLESLLGHPVRYLAYPQGFNNEDVQRATLDGGYRLAFTVSPNTVQPGDNLMALNRLPIFEGDASWTSFIIRLHFSDFIAKTWALRDYLQGHGYTTLANYVPLY